MFLLIGLGNPGKKYKNTRHNIGFVAIDKIIDELSLSKSSDKFNSEIYSGNYDGRKIIAIKPQTFVNLSGESVVKISSFYKIPLERIIVIHDDIDLKFGDIKTKIGGGNAGHNGLKNIDQHIGKNYFRIRIGVGRPENPNFEISDFVLSNFLEDENEEISDIIDRAMKLIKNYINDK